MVRHQSPRAFSRLVRRSSPEPPLFHSATPCRRLMSRRRRLRDDMRFLAKGRSRNFRGQSTRQLQNTSQRFASHFSTSGCRCDLEGTRAGHMYEMATPIHVDPPSSGSAVLQAQNPVRGRSLAAAIAHYRRTSIRPVGWLRPSVRRTQCRQVNRRRALPAGKQSASHLAR
jgi:hypothetical protein